MWIPIIVTAVVTSLIHLFVVAPVLYWSLVSRLNARLERTMQEKFDQQKKVNDEAYAPKSDIDTLKSDMKRVVALFERIDDKLDRFLTTKPA